MLSLNVPSEWPFDSPVVPGRMMPSGNAYHPTSDGTVLVLPEDVAILLGYGFTAPAAFSGERRFEVDLNDLSNSTVNLPRSE
jgi:hypothetical protein